MSELNHMIVLINEYLKRSHLYVQTAALKGALCLMESAAKTNTTMGGASEEIQALRNLIVSYVTKFGIIDERFATHQ